MSNALLLSGGAPNLAFMAGGLCALDEKSVKFDVISTSGAGMLVGLLYAAPPGKGPISELRDKALKGALNMYVEDTIFGLMEQMFCPANYKVFHKPGAIAEMYTRMAQMMTQMLPKIPIPIPEAQRFVNDWTQFVLSTFCPTDLGPWSKGTCQPAPFIDEMVDFEKMKTGDSDFYMNAYCLETQRMETFSKAKGEITPEHFKAALAMPLIYAPYKLQGKTYIEGSAMDTINFEAVMENYYEPAADHEMHPVVSGKAVPDKYQPKPGVKRVDTLLVFNMLGHKELIREPRHLFDALSMSMIVPLVPMSNDDIKLFKLEYRDRYRKGNPNFDLLEVTIDLTKKHWSKALDWSYENGERLFEAGYEAVNTQIFENEDKAKRLLEGFPA